MSPSPSLQDPSSLPPSLPHLCLGLLPRVDQQGIRHIFIKKGWAGLGKDSRRKCPLAARVVSLLSVAIPYWGLVLAGLWEVVENVRVVSPEPIPTVSAREGAGPKGALVPLVVQPSSPPWMGSREQPWAPAPQRQPWDSGIGFPQPCRWLRWMVTIEFRAPILSLPSPQSVGGEVAWLLGVGLRPWVRGSSSSLRTEGLRRPLRKLWRRCSRSFLAN